MNSKAQSPILTESQTACLVALRLGNKSKTHVAIQAKINLIKAAAALERLNELGLAKRGEFNKWHPTGRGKNCRFKTIPDSVRRGNLQPGPGGRRLLKVLDRPMRGRELAKSLDISLQRVRQLVIKLHALGLVKFGDPKRILDIVARVQDKTVLLSHDEARVLSATSDDYATDITKIRIAVLRSQKRVQQILDRLITGGFVAAQEGIAGDTVYRVTAAGLKHPQRQRSGRRAQAPRLPVESDRVHAVLAAILGARSLRIRDLSNSLQIPHASINALMQYLKRKALVQKTSGELTAPYSLTGRGLEALTELARRHAA